MATADLALKNDYTDLSTISKEWLNGVAGSLDNLTSEAGELFGAGFLLSTDFNGSVSGGLAVSISGSGAGGGAIVGSVGQKLFVQQSGSVIVSGLTASNTNYVYLNRDGTYTPNITGVAPSGSQLCCTVVCDGTHSTSVNNLPAGRVNLGHGPYLPLSGGTLTGAITSSVAASSNGSLFESVDASTSSQNLGLTIRHRSTANTTPSTTLGAYLDLGYQWANAGPYPAARLVGYRDNNADNYGGFALQTLNAGSVTEVFHCSWDNGFFHTNPAPTNANYGLMNVGTGGFGGGGAPAFNGNASGTRYAGNASASTIDWLNWQVQGVTKFLVAGDGHVLHPIVPPATTQYGTVSLGGGGFAGGAGNFSGSANGTHLAVNAAAASTADYANWQTNGVSVVRFQWDGHVTVAGQQPTAKGVGGGNGSAFGSLVSVTGGVGGDSADTAATVTGGAGAAWLWNGGAGGRATAAATTGTGGAGGAFVILTGPGAVQALATANNISGASGALTLSVAAGGAATTATTGTNTAGAGGNVSITAGAAGSAANGTANTAGAAGIVNITAGTGGTGDAPTVGGALNITAGAAAAQAGATAGTTTVLGGSASSTGSGGAGGNVAIQARNAGGDGTVARAGGALTLFTGVGISGVAPGVGGTFNWGPGGGGNFTGTTGGTGGAGALLFNNFSGAGGTASACTSGNAIGGAGGGWNANYGPGGAAASTGTANNTGGAGGIANNITGPGGAATGNTTGNNLGGNSGAATYSTGTGGAANNANATPGTITGGNSGAMTISTGAGGATNTGATAIAGNAGLLSVAGGAGGASTVTVGNGTAGNGAGVTIAAGNGGASNGATAGTNTAGNAGSLTLKAGIAGAATNGGVNTNGASGSILLQTSTGTGAVVTRFQITNAGSMVAGSGSNVGTTATDGFLYIPCGSGAPTGVPTAFTGSVPLYYDIANDFLYIYRASWKKSTVYA